MLERERVIDLTIENIKHCKFQSDIKAFKTVGIEILKMGKFWAMYMTLCGCKDLKFTQEILTDKDLVKPFLKPV